MLTRERLSAAQPRKYYEHLVIVGPSFLKDVGTAEAGWSMGRTVAGAASTLYWHSTVDRSIHGHPM